MMNKTVFITLTVLLLTVCDSKKITWNRGSNTRRTSHKPAPTSSSGHGSSSILQPSQTSVQKSSLSGWQEKPKQAPGQTHSYPSSQTGLSGSGNQNTPNRNAASNQQQSHAYPPSPGNSGSAGSSYPQQQGGGLSGAGAPPAYPGLNTGNQPARAPQQNNGYPTSHGLSGSSSSGAGYPQQGSGLSGGAPPPYPGNTGHAGGYSNGGNYPGNNYHGSGYHHPQGPPPPYGSHGYGGHGGGFGAPGSQMPGYYGNSGNRGFGGGMSRSGSALTGVGLAGAGIGTVLTGLALWNLARSTGRTQHTVIYDNRGQPVAVAPNNDTTPAVDPMFADLVNCTLTIAGPNATEVLAIPCSIATSFSPEAEVKDLGVSDAKDTTKCTITVITKAGKEFMTTIPCSVLLNSAAENNVTEPPVVFNETDVALTNSTDTSPNNPIGQELFSQEEEINKLNCSTDFEPGAVRDPVNPCFAMEGNVTVLPLNTNDATPQAA